MPHHRKRNKFKQNKILFHHLFFSNIWNTVSTNQNQVKNIFPFRQMCNSHLYSFELNVKTIKMHKDKRSAASHKNGRDHDIRKYTFIYSMVFIRRKNALLCLLSCLFLSVSK